VATDAQRRHLHGLMGYTLANAALIHYAQQRPMDCVRLTETQLRAKLDAGRSISLDCSEAVTCLCKWAGLHDPNGLHYNGSGYTGTLLAHLPHYSDPTKAKVGALCVFGPAPGEHVAMVMEPGANPVMWSHGGESGPIRISFERERAVHRRPATFLSIAAL
jgi:hypothetical protein